MRITKKALQQIIKEEILKEYDDDDERIIVYYSHPGMGLKIPGITQGVVGESDWTPILKQIAPSSWASYLDALETANMGWASEISIMWALVASYALKNNLAIDGGPGEDLLRKPNVLIRMIKNQVADIDASELEEMSEETGLNFLELPHMIRQLV